MAGDNAGDDVGEIGIWVDAVELRGFYERGDCRPMLATAVGTGEEGILPIESDRSDRAFDDVGVDLDAAVVKEAAEPGPARERVADRFGQLDTSNYQCSRLARG
jgi:hypothetical protein